MLLLSLEL